jgi:hypothetical protein
MDGWETPADVVGPPACPIPAADLPVPLECEVFGRAPLRVLPDSVDTPFCNALMKERNMAEPAAKGIIVGGVVVNLNRFRNAGLISAEELEARLSAEAQQLLDTKIDPATWYPIGAYRELLDIVWEIDGKKSPDYMREKGLRWARKIYDSGMYQQLEYSDNAPKVTSGDQAVRQGRLIGSLIGTFWNFVQATVDLDDDGALRLTLRNSAEFPDANRYTTEGFLNHIIERASGKGSCSSERATVDEIVFLLPLAVKRSESSD